MMNTVQSTQEKRTIRVRDFLEDFRGGASDADLMAKYNLTSAGLDRFYTLLIEREILEQEEWSARQASQAARAQIEADSAEPTEFVCPSCAYTDSGPFDQCPRCGLSIKDFMEDLPPFQYAVTDGRRQHGESHHGAITAGRGLVGVDDSEIVSAFGRSPEIPLREKPTDGQETRPARVHQVEGIGDAPEFPAAQPGSEFDREEVIPGIPLQYSAGSGHERGEEVAVCDNCKERLYPELRRVYDRSGSLLALALSVLMLMMGFAGAWGVTLFKAYSATRLFVIYFTGMSLLLGCIFMAIAVFMLLLAREKALCCYNCGRSFPSC
ncbi:MAG: hypothetical protein FJ118_00570 [Deltaproteobacteria bacterium]|nr:hypothetical protein [Deltaproteobacteria bacterium]